MKKNYFVLILGFIISLDISAAALRRKAMQNIADRTGGTFTEADVTRPVAEVEREMRTKAVEKATAAAVAAETAAAAPPTDETLRRAEEAYSLVASAKLRDPEVDAAKARAQEALERARRARAAAEAEVRAREEAVREAARAAAEAEARAREEAARAEARARAEADRRAAAAPRSALTVRRVPMHVPAGRVESSADIRTVAYRDAARKIGPAFKAYLETANIRTREAALDEIRANAEAWGYSPDTIFENDVQQLRFKFVTKGVRQLFAEVPVQYTKK